MDIVSQVIIRYSAYCSCCGAHGPVGYSRQDAEQAALEEGWRQAGRLDGFRHLKRTLCPLCYAEHEKAEETPWP